MSNPIVTEHQVKIMEDILRRVDMIKTLAENNANLQQDVLNFEEKVRTRRAVIEDNAKLMSMNYTQLTLLHTELLQMVKDIVYKSLPDPDQLPLETGMGREA